MDRIKGSETLEEKSEEGGEIMDNLFVFLIILFCTPLGWIGMLCFAVAVSAVRSK